MIVKFFVNSSFKEIENSKPIIIFCQYRNIHFEISKYSSEVTTYIYVSCPEVLKLMEFFNFMGKTGYRCWMYDINQ